MSVFVSKARAAFDQFIAQVEADHSKLAVAHAPGPRAQTAAGADSACGFSNRLPVRSEAEDHHVAHEWTREEDDDDDDDGDENDGVESIHPSNNNNSSSSIHRGGSCRSWNERTLVEVDEEWLARDAPAAGLLRNEQRVTSSLSSLAMPPGLPFSLGLGDESRDAEMPAAHADLSWFTHGLSDQDQRGLPDEGDLRAFEEATGLGMLMQDDQPSGSDIESLDGEVSNESTARCASDNAGGSSNLNESDAPANLSMEDEQHTTAGDVNHKTPEVCGPAATSPGPRENARDGVDSQLLGGGKSSLDTDTVVAEHDDPGKNNIVDLYAQMEKEILAAESRAGALALRPEHMCGVGIEALSESQLFELETLAFDLLDRTGKLRVARARDRGIAAARALNANRSQRDK